MAAKPVVSLQKLTDLETIVAARAHQRAAGKTLVWTNGCFDILHVGHVRSLQAARVFGDILVVGVNSDASVRRLKGPTRPIVPENERVEILAGLACVDHVIVFDDSLPSAVLERLQPDVHCKGADYAPPHGKPIPEASVVAAYGGRIEFLPLVPDVSTSGLVSRVAKKRANMIYLASPYSHPNPEVVKQRYLDACAATSQLIRLGKVVYTPVIREHALAPFGHPPSWDCWGDFDTHMIKLADEFHVLMLDGWKESVGVKNKMRVARNEGKTIVYLAMETAGV